MKKLLLGAAIGVLAVCSTFAALPTYKTLSGYGNSTAGASVYFPSDPNSQIRVIYVQYGNDKANFVNFATGTTAFTQVATNALSSSVTNILDSTNGLSASAPLVLEHAGVAYPAIVSSFNATSSTNSAGVTNWTYNVVLGSGGWGVNTSVGDNVYLMSTNVTLPIGIGTNVLAGDDIYSGNYGRPVVVSIPAATNTNSLYSVSTHYDSASQ